MANVALVEKYPSNYGYESLFPFEIDKFALVNDKQDKVLKRDITLDINEVKEKYEYIILVGKEPCKFVADIRSVTEFQGYLVDEKYLGIVNPMAVKLRPSMKGAFDNALNNIIRIVDNNEKSNDREFMVVGIETVEEAKNYLTKLLAKIIAGEIDTIALDTETSSLYPRDGYVLGISISHAKESGVYIDSLALTENNVEILQDIINRVTILFFNAKFDMKMLQYHFNLTFNKWEDVMLEHYTLDENDVHALKPLCIKYTDLGDYDKDLEEFKNNYCKTHGVLRSNFTYDLIPFEIIYKYAALDTAGTYELHSKFAPHILSNDKLKNVYNNILKPGTLFLLKMEENGIPIDLNYLEDAHKELDDEIAKLEEKLYSYNEVKSVEASKGALFNVNSTAHVACLFHEIMGIPVIKRTEKGNPSVDAEVLDTLAKDNPVANIINEIKKLKKIRSTYLDKIKAGVDRDSRLRTNFNLHTVTSGRLSSSGKLNAQQLPRDNKIPKKCMKARPEYKIISQDLKTAEMYVASVLSGDKVLQQIFVEGQDYHGSMAIQKFGLPCEPNQVAEFYPNERQAAKTISFEILYKLNYREPALKNFKTLKKWLQDQESFIKDNGYIYSFFGRKRRVSDVFSPNKQEAQHNVRSAINFLVQSVASDINLLAAIEMQNWIEKNNYQKYMIIWGLVHDSILAEVHNNYIDKYLHKLREFTQKDRGLSIPGCPIGIDVEIGQSYGTVEAI